MQTLAEHQSQSNRRNNSSRSAYFARKGASLIIRASDDFRKAADCTTDPLHQERLRHIADLREQAAESCRPFIKALRSQRENAL